MLKKCILELPVLKQLPQPRRIGLPSPESSRGDPDAAPYEQLHLILEAYGRNGAMFQSDTVT